MKKVESPIEKLKKKIFTEINLLREILSINKSLKKADDVSRKKLESHIKSLELYLKRIQKEIIFDTEKIVANAPLAKYSAPIQKISVPEKTLQSVSQYGSSYKLEKESAGSSLKEVDEEEDKTQFQEETVLIEKEALKRLTKKKEEKVEVKTKKLSPYTKTATRLFSDYARKLIEKGFFKNLDKDLIKSNLEFVLGSYICLIFFTTLISISIGIFIMIFFLFFNIGAELPIITLAKESIGERFLKVFWIVFIIPIGTFISMYIYPSLEKKAVEAKINQELPFVTIHMAAISGSMIDLTKIFKIIIDTGEYHAISKEFTKLLNQINIYGYDIVGGLRNMAFNNPSRKLSDLFNSLATAISSGGHLPDFFDKRANSLLFEHRLEKEKQAKSAETFMDIYISVVIAAPMILMLMLMMLKIGGLGISLSTGTITLVMVLGVTIINIFFLTFLHLKQPAE